MAHNPIQPSGCPNGIPCAYVAYCSRISENLKEAWTRSEDGYIRIFSPEGSAQDVEDGFGDKLRAYGYHRDGNYLVLKREVLSNVDAAAFKPNCR